MFKDMNELSNDYEAALAIMVKAKSVDHWNKLRQGLKKEFTTQVINKIDASRLIVKLGL